MRCRAVECMATAIEGEDLCGFHAELAEDERVPLKHGSRPGSTKPNEAKKRLKAKVKAVIAEVVEKCRARRERERKNRAAYNARKKAREGNAAWDVLEQVKWQKEARNETLRRNREMMAERRKGAA